jgi:AraC family transcriptional regulator of adaptative response/methylated-DNA-[protein]-cysteine methyltransferase
LLDRIVAERFVVADTWVGRLLAARSEQGLCWVSLGDDDEALEGEVRAVFPAVEPADAATDDPELRGWVAQIIEHLDGSRAELELPLDVRGSLFQRRVWWALRSIQYGQTKSYGEIGRSLGVDVAPRAVARACAANVLAVVIPCHRAVGQDGDLTGYRWGLGRKQLLLERERLVSGAPTQLTLL